MKIFKIKNRTHNFMRYNSVGVICAESEKEALALFPEDEVDTTVTEIGTAIEGLEKGVISFYFDT